MSRPPSRYTTFDPAFDEYRRADADFAPSPWVVNEPGRGDGTMSTYDPDYGAGTRRGRTSRRPPSESDSMTYLANTGRPQVYTSTRGPRGRGDYYRPASPRRSCVDTESFRCENPSARRSRSRSRPVVRREWSEIWYGPADRASRSVSHHSRPTSSTAPPRWRGEANILELGSNTQYPTRPLRGGDGYVPHNRRASSATRDSGYRSREITRMSRSYIVPNELKSRNARAQ